MAQNKTTSLANILFQSHVFLTSSFPIKNIFFGGQRGIKPASSKYTMDSSDIPILDPPAGVSSNFIDPVSNASVYLATSAVFLALMLVLVVMRMWVKLVVLQAPSLDDGKLFLFYGDVLTC